MLTLKEKFNNEEQTRKVKQLLDDYFENKDITIVDTSCIDEEHEREKEFSYRKFKIEIKYFQHLRSC